MDKNMKKPAVTVFMPIYNAEKYINEAIDSILNQTFTDFELLIINDGSTDRSVKIVEGYHDPRIRLIHNDGNKGLPYTRNRGLELAQGKYLAIMDADDVSALDRLQIQYEIMEKKKNLVVLASDKELLDEEASLSYGLKEKLYSYLFYGKPEHLRIDLMFHNILINSSTMIRLEFLEQHSIKYNKDCVVMQDYELWTQICGANGEMAILKKPLVKYRTHSENISNKTRSKKSEMRKQLQFNIQKEYIRRLGFGEESEIVEYLHRFGLEFEEQKDDITIEYLEALYMFYKTILKESKEKKVFNYAVLVSYLRKRYLLMVSKYHKRSGWYFLRGLFLN